MKCNHCNSEWKTDENFSSSLTSCPFCGKSLVKEEAPKIYDNSKDALAAIMKQFGPDILLGKLNAHFPDFASVSIADKRLVYAVYELGASKVLKNNLNASQADKEIAVKIAIRTLTEAFIVPDMAESIIHEFAAALGWQVEKAVSQPVPPASSSRPAIMSGPAALQPSPSTIPVPGSMVRIQGGTFTMGSPANEPERFDNEIQHKATVSAFYMGKYPVTQAEYQAVMGANPSRFRGDSLPVEQVSWYDAIEYCNHLSQKEGLTPAYTVRGTDVICNWKANGYRLPTEAEWEYACRAGTSTPFNTGNNITTDQANYNGNYPYNNNIKGIHRKKTTAVGSFAANPWGLYDMHGNVWEWCWDWYGDYSRSAETDPVGAPSGSHRVIRGGGWFDFTENLRSAFRRNNIPSLRRYGSVGFRLVRG